MNKTIKYIAWICLLVYVSTCIGCENKPQSLPILKVITSSQVGTTIFSTKYYYIVYENGKTKKTSEFQKSEVISFAFNPEAQEKDVPNLHDVDLNNPEEAKYNDAAAQIVSLIENDEKVYSPGELYVIDNKIYFKALRDYGINSCADTLYEYIPSDNKFKRIASFKGSITHVEAY